MIDIALSLQERAAPQMQCFCCGPAHPTGLRIRSFWDDSGEFVHMRHTPRPEFLGFPGLVYGGLLAMLVDCHSGWTVMAWHYRQEKRPPESSWSINSLLTVMVHLSGCSAVSCQLTVYTKFRTPSAHLDQFVGQNVARSETFAMLQLDGDLNACRGRINARRDLLWACVG